MTYIDGFDIDDELYEELKARSEEEDVTIEEAIIDVLRDEFSVFSGAEEDEDEDDIVYLDDEPECGDED